MDNISAIVLAAGKGTRMKSDLPKVLHKIGNKPMIYYTLDLLQRMKIKSVYVVVSHKAELVVDSLKDKYTCKFVFQDVPLGTADAVKSALGKIDLDLTKNVIVLNGDDSAFYKKATLDDFIQSHQKTNTVISMMTIQMTNPKDLGRIIRDANDDFKKIIEKSEEGYRECNSNEVNSGLYLIQTEWLFENIDKIQKSQKGEYYLTDLLNLASSQNLPVNLYKIQNQDEWLGINNQDDLKKANEKFEMKKR